MNYFIWERRKLMYRIEMITGTDGNERTDGRYTLRKGCVGKMYLLDIGQVMIFEYIKDNQGNEKSGYLRTSIVEDYNLYENGVTVYTMNSVYYFKIV
jgi:hypothetical protein